MKTSWSETDTIDSYLSETMSPEEMLVFEAKVLTSPSLRIQVALHRAVLSIVRCYDRRKRIVQIQTLMTETMNDPSREEFQNKIMSIFKS